MKIKRLKNKKYRFVDYDYTNHWFDDEKYGNGYFTDYSYVANVDDKIMEFVSYEEYLEYITGDLYD